MKTEIDDNRVLILYKVWYGKCHLRHRHSLNTEIFKNRKKHSLCQNTHIVTIEYIIERPKQFPFDLRCKIHIIDSIATSAFQISKMIMYSCMDTHIYRMVFKEYLKQLNRLYDITCSTISNTSYNLIFTTKFNDSSILITIISCDYLNLSLADEHVGDVTIPSQVIEYNQNFLQADQPIRLKYSNQIKLFDYFSVQW